MASYAANFTSRIKLYYNHLGVEYSALWRYDQQNFGASEVAGLLASFYGQFMELSFTDFAFTRAEYSLAGDDFFLPFNLPPALTALTPTGSAPAGAAEYRALALNFNGKTLTGNPWRCYVYGLNVDSFTAGAVNVQDNFRLTRAESPVVDAACAELESLINGGYIIGNDGNEIAAIYGYANVTLSKYRIRRARRG